MIRNAPGRPKMTRKVQPCVNVYNLLMVPYSKREAGRGDGETGTTRDTGNAGGTETESKIRGGVTRRRRLRVTRERVGADVRAAPLVRVKAKSTVTFTVCCKWKTPNTAF